MLFVRSESMAPKSNRRLELGALLTAWRARLRPEDVGLPVHRHRHVAGLCREEVAELVEVSPNWYGYFEAGRVDLQFSTGFVSRVASALRLNDRERLTLFRLALPEIGWAADQVERSTEDGALQSLAGVRDLSRRINAASSFEEAVAAGVRTIERILSPTCIATANLGADGTLPRTIAVGKRADFVEPVSFARACLFVNLPNAERESTYNESWPAYKETGAGAFVLHQQTAAGYAFDVGVVNPDPSKDEAAGEQLISAPTFWDWNSKLRARCSLTHGLFSAGVYRGNIGALWTEPHATSAALTELLRTVSAIVELAGTYIVSA